MGSQRVLRRHSEAQHIVAVSRDIDLQINTFAKDYNTAAYFRSYPRYVCPHIEAYAFTAKVP